MLKRPTENMNYLLAVCLFALALVSCDKNARSDDPEAVQQCFDSYKAAILAQDGEEAVAELSKETIEAYQEYVDTALSGDEAAVRALSFINRMQVLLLRHRVPLDTLATFDGRRCLVYAVDNDWIGKNGVIRTELGKINVSNDRATTEVLIEGQLAPNRFQFRRENEDWKFDLNSIMVDSNMAMKEAVKQAGMDEDEFIFALIESVSGEKLDSSIWLPLR